MQFTAGSGNLLQSSEFWLLHLHNLKNVESGRILSVGLKFDTVKT